MIGSNMIAGLIVSSTSNETFEEDFTGISEVKFFASISLFEVFFS